MTTTQQAANEAPYKIQKRGDKFVVVNNAGMTKSTFKSNDDALKYLRALYANVPGAAKKADKTPWTGKAPKPTKAAAASSGTMIDGDDVDPKSLASAVDAALDAAYQQIHVNSADIGKLPGWAQQVISLTVSAGETIDELLEAMGIPDPDGGSPMTIRAQVEIAAYLQKAKSFTQDKRDMLAKKGVALPDGSFPIENEDDLDNAIQAFGRAGNKAAAKAHIKKRAAALGATGKLPDGWK